MKHTPIKSMSGIYEQDHLVQFYVNQDELLRNLSNFIGAGIKAGDPCIVVATPEHLEALEQLLIDAGYDTAGARDAKKYVCLDAEDTLLEFMDGRLPNRQNFEKVVGNVLGSIKATGKVTRVFGEMVAILWGRDNQTGAILLEQLWNDIAKRHSFTLFCAYPMHYFEEQGHSQLLGDVTRLHSVIVPGAKLDPV